MLAAPATKASPQMLAWLCQDLGAYAPPTAAEPSPPASLQDFQTYVRFCDQGFNLTSHLNTE